MNIQSARSSPCEMEIKIRNRNIDEQDFEFSSGQSSKTAARKN